MKFSIEAFERLPPNIEEKYKKKEKKSNFNRIEMMKCENKKETHKN